MSEFKPVKLLSPRGVTVVADTPVELNDLIASGYVRVKERASEKAAVKPDPKPVAPKPPVKPETKN